MHERPVHVRQLAAELELLAHGKVANLNPSGTAASADQHGPTPDPDIWHLRFLAQYDRASGPTSREQVVDHWRNELRMLRGHGIKRSAGETIEEEDARILKDGKGWSVDEVARRFRCTPTRVRRVRLAARVDVETGEGHVIDRAAEARRMRAEGMTIRHIAFALGWSKSSVQRAVGDRDAA